MKKSGLESKDGALVGNAHCSDITAPAHFTAPEELYTELIQTIRDYHPSADLTLIEKAYNIARNAHKDQKRK